MRIAICDDEKRLRKDLRALVEVQLDLCGADYTIEEFEDGAELLKSETVKELDLLFLDIEMPKTDGMETARRLRQAGCKMLIIFVTAYPDFVFQGYEVQGVSLYFEAVSGEKDSGSASSGCRGAGTFGRKVLYCRTEVGDTAASDQPSPLF